MYISTISPIVSTSMKQLDLSSFLPNSDIQIIQHPGLARSGEPQRFSFRLVVVAVCPDRKEP